MPPLLDLTASGTTVFQVFPTFRTVWEAVEHPGVEMHFSITEPSGRKPPNACDQALFSDGNPIQNDEP